MNTLNKRGFTLVELLIVVVLIGILASIAIPRFSGTRERAYVAQMQSSLRNGLTEQILYQADNNDYATTAELETFGWVSDEGVNVVWTPSSPNAAYGVVGVATHDATEAQCGVQYGTSGAGGTNYTGQVVCTATGSPFATD